MTAPPVYDIDPQQSPIGSEETPMPDSEAAPYGYKLDGTPKLTPGGRPAGKRARAARSGARTGQATAPPPRPKPKSTARRTATDYTPGLVGLFSLAALPLKFAGLELDAAAVLLNADEIATAVNETAKERAEIAALCDRVLQVGPYGLILMAFTKLGAQIAENHGLAPTSVTTKLGAIPRDDLKARLGIMVKQAETQAQAEDVAGAEYDRAYAASVA